MHQRRASRGRAGWLLAGLAALRMTTAAFGHDSWVIAETFRDDGGWSLVSSFITSERFPLPEAPTQPQRVREWLIIGGHGRTSVAHFALEDNALVNRARLPQPGPGVVAVELSPRFIEIEAGKFQAYLRDESATAALQRRAASNASARPGRELYTKLAKALVMPRPTDRPAPSGAAAPVTTVPHAVGRRDAAHPWLEPVGHALEIVPATDPLLWRPGSPAMVRVLLRDRPAAGLVVCTGRPGLAPHEYVERATTDAEGRATLRFDRPGLWFARTHVIEPVEDRPDHDWASCFASLTLTIQDRTNPSASRPADSP